ncbi:MAG TPA: VWA domain-containing protein [Pyrinomonadaceae bacterium]|nr:VWA domain-containing protein [Pyrinomonadaceae bacterium]
MRKALALILAAATLYTAAAQTTAPQQTPPQQTQDDEIVRITTQLIQVDAVVTDKDDHVIPDLKLSDFSLYENGKKQDLQFIEYVGADSKTRTDGNVAVAGRAVESDVARNVSAQDLHRVFAFVVDDLTIPFEDLKSVRSMLTDFVDNRMAEGDLVAIVRVVGGVGMLEQFTSDKQLLRRAIADLTPRSHPFSVFNNPDSGESLGSKPAAAVTGGDSSAFTPPASPGNNIDSDVAPDGYTRGARALSALSVTGTVVDSMKTLPGRKNLVLISGGLPVFESTQTQISADGAPIQVQEVRDLQSNVEYMLRLLADHASRAGVVINTLDIRGLKASRGVSLFTDPGNEGKSALGNFDSSNANAGRAPDMARLDNTSLDTLSAHQGLEALADTTGGISVINTNNFEAGIERVVNRSSYYLLAYKPSESFDNKFHKLQIKVDRPGAKVYTRIGYVATADAPATKSLTKEQEIARAAMAPLAKRDVGLSGAFQYRFIPQNRAAIDVDLRVDAHTLDFKQGPDGKYHATLDLVGFVVNQLGKTTQGFSQTINAALTPDEYTRALDVGLGYTGHVELEAGSYQLRVAVREDETGKLGTLSKYLEVPDMSKKRLTMSSVFLHAVEPGNKQAAPLSALRQIPRKDDLRFSAIVYNPKLQGGKPQITGRLILQRGGATIFDQPVQTVDIRGSDDTQFLKLGQIGLSRLQPGHYILTFVLTDTLADKKVQTLARSIDFQVTD